MISSASWARACASSAGKRGAWAANNGGCLTVAAITPDGGGRLRVEVEHRDGCAGLISGDGKVNGQSGFACSAFTAENGEGFQGPPPLFWQQVTMLTDSWQVRKVTA